MNYYPLIRPLLFCLKAEDAHHAAILALRLNLLPKQKCVDDPALHMTIGGLTFKNPVGMAAGFDKNADAIKGLFSQGFGFVETGTVTPKPQGGNAKPRLFRLSEDNAVINRMGFNNKGLPHYKAQLEKWQQNKPEQFAGVLGANIGRNKESPNDASDYTTMLEGVYGLSDYITVNISSPNTPGLRDMQKFDILNGFLKNVMEKRNQLAKTHGKIIPVFVKIAPDIDATEQESIAQAVVANALDGLFIGNTSVGLRNTLKNTSLANEQGGLSGAPIFAFSTAVLKNMHQLTKGRVPLIGAGGIGSAEEAYAKIRAGASLVQVYSMLIYKGFSLIPTINTGLLALLKKDGLSRLADAVGVDAGK
jgi:dihydroorotate dehydrogenase